MKQVLHGKSYDYVFDVDVGDGTVRKLGFNNGGTLNHTGRACMLSPVMLFPLSVQRIPTRLRRSLYGRRKSIKSTWTRC